MKLLSNKSLGHCPEIFCISGFACRACAGTVFPKRIWPVKYLKNATLQRFDVAEPHYCSMAAILHPITKMLSPKRTQRFAIINRILTGQLVSL